MKVQKDLHHYKNTEYALQCKRFFKTGKGDYAEGDKFLGIRIPDIRKVAKQHKNLSLKHIKVLVQSPWHEERMLGLLILVDQYKKDPEVVYQFYLKSFPFINNWDLVDVTAHKIIGLYLYDKNRKILYEWAKSKNLWTRRISMMATFHFIKQNDFKDTIRIAGILLNDEHDLIHKVVGWMLREVGKREQSVLVQYLSKSYQKMPRTMLRYAIEKFPESQRKKYLAGKI